MGNLDLYNKFRKPPKEALKDFDNGNFKGTDINTMWRIKALTEQFGPCGIGWYYSIDKLWLDKVDEETIMAFAVVSLYIKHEGEWSKPIVGTGGNKLAYKTGKGYIKVSDEGYKMAVTDAFGKACQLLGIGADIYWENDTSKYTIQAEAEKKERIGEFEEAQKILFDTALKYGFMPNQVQDKFFEVKGKQLFLAEPSELRKMAEWYNKEYGKKQAKQGV